MNKMTDLLKKMTGLEKDKKFLEQFKGDWNRLCNSYVTEANRNPGEYARGRQHDDAPYLPQMVDLGKRYLRLHRIFTKQKILPDPKFSVSTDESFKVTLAKMHDFLSANPYPTKNKLDPDAAYDIRWRGTMLIDYLIDLSERPGRFLSTSLIRLSIYALIPIGLLSGIIALLSGSIALIKAAF